MAEDCSRIEGELDSIISILQGHDKSNVPIEVNVHDKQELAIVKKFDLQPKSSASGLNHYINKNKITADMVRGLDIETRHDGMLVIVLVWGRVYPTIIAGPKGDPGDSGPAGDKGAPGLDAKCQCIPVITPLPSSTSSVSSSSLLPSSSSDSSSSTLSSSSSDFTWPSNYILDELGDPILDEFGDPILDES